MKKIIAVILVMLVFLCGCSTSENERIIKNDNSTAKSVIKESTTEEDYRIIEKINHYVMDTDVEKCAADSVKEIYKTLVDAIYQRKEKVYLSKSYDDNLYALSILKSNPAYFVVKNTSFFDNHKSVKIEYNYKKSKHNEILNYIDNEYLDILNEIIKPNFNELDKVLAVYRYFSSRIEYDYDWLDGFNMSDEKYLYPDIAVYEALKNNKGVCHSYAYLCHYAFQQLGIKSFCVTGDMKNSDEGHMWLLVEIYGKYYHIDPTWDRGIDEQVGLEYFGMTDKERAKDLTLSYNNIDIDMDFGEISCTDTAFSGFHNSDILDFNFDVKGKMIVTKTNGKDVYFNTSTLKFE
ncbi:MAG: transglutaminase-like domain-containing protein [Acutalibacteraceae bacterium]